MGYLVQGEFFQQASRDIAAEINLAIRYTANGAGPFGDASLLQQVATGARAQGLPVILFVFVARENNHLHVRKVFMDTPSGFEAIETWHGNVHENHVWLKRFDHFERRAAIAGFTEDFHSWYALQFGPDAGAYNRVVVSQHYANSLLSIAHQ